MADILTGTPRPLYLEDLAVTTDPDGETASVTVYGAPINPNTLHKIAVVLYTAFQQAANDVAAAAAGVAVGTVYYNTTTSTRKARMT